MKEQAIDTLGIISSPAEIMTTKISSTCFISDGKGCYVCLTSNRDFAKNHIIMRLRARNLPEHIEGILSGIRFATSDIVEAHDSMVKLYNDSIAEHIGFRLNASFTIKEKF